MIHQGGHKVLYMKLSEPFLIIAAFMEGLTGVGTVPILCDSYHMSWPYDYPCSR